MSRESGFGRLAVRAVDPGMDGCSEVRRPAECARLSRTSVGVSPTTACGLTVQPSGHFVFDITHLSLEMPDS
jgi:hypothetical protein